MKSHSWLWDESEKYKGQCEIVSFRQEQMV